MVESWRERERGRNYKDEDVEETNEEEETEESYHLSLLKTSWKHEGHVLYLKKISTRMGGTLPIIPMAFKNYWSNQMQILCGVIEAIFVNTLI